MSVEAALRPPTALFRLASERRPGQAVLPAAAASGEYQAGLRGTGTALGTAAIPSGRPDVRVAEGHGRLRR
jgi:hypothetical protein